MLRKHLPPGFALNVRRITASMPRGFSTTDLRNAPSRSVWLTWALGLLLALDAAGCVGLGSIRLVWGKWACAEDLYLRWVEERNFVARRNPAFLSPDAVSPYVEQSAVRENGLLATVDYPPWAYVTELIFVPPLRWRIVRWVFFAWSALALIGLSCWTSLKFIQFGNFWRFAGALLPLSIWPVSHCLSIGQNAVIVTALLAASLVLLSRNWDVAAGILLGIALFKANIALPFFVVFLVLGRWRALAAAISLNALTTACAWLITGISPFVLIDQSLENAHRVQSASQNVVSKMILMTCGPNRAVELGVMAAVLLAGAGLMALAKKRGCGELTLFAIAAVIGLSSTYRKEYDAVIILFLFMSVPLVALRTGSPGAWLSFAFCGAFLFLPFRLKDHNLPAIEALELLSWIIALIVLLRLDIETAHVDADSLRHPKSPSIT
jgi:hypothetical protein